MSAKPSLSPAVAKLWPAAQPAADNGPARRNGGGKKQRATSSRMKKKAPGLDRGRGVPASAHGLLRIRRAKSKCRQARLFWGGRAMQGPYR